MNRKFLKGILVGIVALMTVELGIVFAVDKLGDGIGIYLGADNGAFGKDTAKTMSKMETLQAYIDKYFMTEVKQENVINGIYKGMLEGLGDPYSCYYTQEEYADIMEDSNGVYCGIGATVTQDPNSGIIYVIEAMNGGAAKEAGIKTGDHITKVNGEDVTGEELTKVVSKMKGVEGTKVKVEFYLAKEKEYKTFTLERRQIEVPTVRYKMKEDSVGYIAVSAFDKPTDEQFIAAVEDLKKQGMKGLIIDLRNNGGGMLDSVVNMLDYMLPQGSTIVSTKDKDGKGETYKAKDKREFDLPLVVLINGNTASASEVFSGAIKDYQMGTLVGTTSFGKGIVQSLMQLEDGSAIKLTTSKYYTPNGNNIHGTGIDPDVEVKLDSDSKKDNQYNEAMRLLKHKIESAEK